MSGSGPFSPIFQGVWQSLHPAVLTMYLPRATRSAVVGALGVVVASARSHPAVAASAIVRPSVAISFRIMRFSFPWSGRSIGRMDELFGVLRGVDDPAPLGAAGRQGDDPAPQGEALAVGAPVVRERPGEVDDRDVERQEADRD